MDRWIERYCRLLEALIALALAVMVVLVFGNVVLRYAFNTSIVVSEELSRWLFVWVTFLGAVVALQQRAHLGTNIVVGRLPPALRRVCAVMAQVLMLWVTWLLLVGSISLTRINLEVEAPVTGMSVGWFYGAGIAFAVPALLLLARDLWLALHGRLGDTNVGTEH